MHGAELAVFPSSENAKNQISNKDAVPFPVVA